MSLFLLQGKAGNRYFGHVRHLKAFFFGFWIGFLVFSNGSFAGSPESWGEWQEAKAFYDAGKFEDSFRSLKTHPSDSGAYFYNLGTTYYRLGQLGNAVAYLEKDNRLQAHDSEIQHNLNLSRSALSKQIGEDRLDPSSTWVETLSDRVPPDEVRSALGLLTFILSLFWLRSYLRSRNMKKTLLQSSAFFGIAGLVLVLTLFLAQKSAESTPAAVALEHQTIRSGPGDHFLELGRVESGTKLRILGPEAMSESAPAPKDPPGSSPPPSAGNPTSVENSPSAPSSSSSTPQELWRQVRYSPEGIGWIRASTLLIL